MATLTESPVVLESGDRLSRAEFHRRYCASPDIRNAELVEGVVYVAPPVRASLHGKPHALVMGWLAFYLSLEPDPVLVDNTTVILDDLNEVQPDAALMRIGPGGPVETDEGYIEGPPQLVVEVAASTASYDLHDKLRAYQRNGVREYIVWRVVDKAIDWFRLRDGAYERVEPDQRGIIESAVFPELRLNVPAMIGGDMRLVLGELERKQ